ncbi:MAG: hypothetical protein QF856_01980, partial [Candidatus Marinimicrobia bacterium]|nr:hypothetical protein [Candidatus Neomarinimicrobiota bacterium]
MGHFLPSNHSSKANTLTMSAVQETAFQEKIDAELKIEAKDWMPDKYRLHLIRQISQHAHSEV